jgi:hypothetical protein
LPPDQPAAPSLQRRMIHSMNRQRQINLLMSNLPGPPSTCTSPEPRSSRCSRPASSKATFH